jgi:single-strand DNA-binding protein
MPDGLNKVMLIGNLGKDPEMSYTANGNALTRFPMAVSRSYSSEEGRREETEWFNVVAWNRLAETLSQHLQKGRKVYVEGRLSTRTYERDGQKRYFTEVVATQVLFLDRPQAAGMGDFGGSIEPDDIPFDN